MPLSTASVMSLNESKSYNERRTIMPICKIIWTEGRSDDLKKVLRTELHDNLSAAVHTRPDQINVYFQDLSTVDMPKDGALVRVYISEGRTQEDKDAVCAAVGNSICNVAGVEMSKINLIITDIPRGNLGVGTNIVNKDGTPSQLMREGKLKEIDAQ